VCRRNEEVGNGRHRIALGDLKVEEPGGQRRR
jgi:hypothetical protein